MKLTKTMYSGYGIDTLLEDLLSITDKVVEPILRLHFAYQLTWMGLRNLRLKFLLN